MLAPASICMTASENIHSIAPQGRVELPSIPNQLMQIQHNFLSRGFQGDCGCGCGCETYSGSGLGQVDASTPVDYGQAQLPAPVQNIVSALGGFGLIEWLIIAGAGYMLLSTIFTTKKAVGAVGGAVSKYKSSVRRRGESKLERERTAHEKRVAAIEGRYGISRGGGGSDRGRGKKY